MKKFKKIALLVATAAMVLGATTSVFAASTNSDTIILDGKGYAECYLSVGNNRADAETYVYSDYSNVPITSYVDVSLTLTYGNHDREADGGSDWDRQNVIDSSSEAIVGVVVSPGVNTGAYARSNHTAEIDGVDGYCGMYASYGNVND